MVINLWPPHRQQTKKAIAFVSSQNCAIQSVFLYISNKVIPVYVISFIFPSSTLIIRESWSRLAFRHFPEHFSATIFVLVLQLAMHRIIFGNYFEFCLATRGATPLRLVWQQHFFMLQIHVCVAITNLKTMLVAKNFCSYFRMSKYFRILFYIFFASYNLFKIIRFTEN